MAKLTKHYNFFIITILIIIILVLSIIDLLNGSVKISFNDAINLLINKSDNNSLNTIFFDIRIPRIITAILSGIALSISGLLMQTLFRNPLAGPYVLGISSGAGLGVALSVMGFSAFGLNFIEVAGSGGSILAACLGSGFFMFLIFVISLKIKDVMTLLVAGMLLGSAASAIINLFQFVSSEQSLKLFVIWTMGSLTNTTWQQLALMSFTILIGVLISIFIAYPLNVWLLGDDNAKSSGININKIRNLLFISATLLAGSVTAFCGPLAFIGIAAPHIARLIFKTSNHKLLIPLSAIIGVIMLLIADILTQLPFTNFLIPINTTTSLLGVPIVLWIVLKGKKMWI
ncbi:MAG: iron ABC transporter [Bacteroidetes bacterium CG02_land_8_20_14_3_00_31_25]|nr:MAG: iron ABC transporter [Bacteroidetes bacterium CG02_land_8_20_14_3_00_31_25]PIX32420.1 MAG: iron ABC transporter [Bacteroidetes bacterium CG_4_8_14_3_um_filter_31_14]